MLGNLANIFRVPDLKRKVLFTFAILAVYRLGAFVPVPFVNTAALQDFWRGMSGGAGAGLFDVVNMFSGGAFHQMTIFALGIMPYISASIILQLLMVVWPRLEKIAKEGQAGQKKINQYTRYGTVGLSAFQAFGLALFMLRSPSGLTLIPNHPLLFTFITIISMTTGTAFIMWLGEKISEHGIGNGISLIIVAGIVASFPTDIYLGIQAVKSESMTPIWFPVILGLMVAVSALIILVQQANRRLPVQYARRIVGRRQMQGSSTFLPLKLNTAGVIPVIFASSILMFPSIIISFFSTSAGGSMGQFSTIFDLNSRANLYTLFGLESGGIFNLLKAINLYTVTYSLLTMFFCYFYTAITFNPLDTAENLKKMGGFVPGRTPGKKTADYIDHVLTRITFVGAVFLVFVAVLPLVIQVAFNIPYAMVDLIGGTGLIIVVGVVLDTVKQIESQLLMRHYEGFDYKSRSRRRWEFKPSSTA